MEPQPRIGIAQLTKSAFEGRDLNPIRNQLITQALSSTDMAGALMDIAVIDQLAGHRESGLEWQTRAIEACRLFRTGREAPGKNTLLVFAAPGDIGGNTPVEFLLGGSEFEIITCYPQIGTAGAKALDLPPHDVAFCAAPADASNATEFYETVRALTAQSGVPVLNLPEAGGRLDRRNLSRVLSDIAGVRVPTTIEMTRPALEAGIAAGDLLHRTALIRPQGSHAGHGLAKLSSAEGLQDYLRASAEQVFQISTFVDYASMTDGQHRKYRVVLIDGQAFPCHMAIATRWDVWYMNAEMEESELKRAEEQAFMDGFADGFGYRHKTALDKIADRIGLEYVGIDCAEDAEGNLIVFEADNALIVHDMDCPKTFPYKKRHMANLFDAFEGMLAEHSRVKGPHGSETPPNTVPWLAVAQ